MRLAGWLAGPQAWLAGPQAWLAGPQAWLDGPEGGTNGWTDGRTENLPILQDFVPYQGRCPASPHENKEEKEQSKGTADHLMPLGYLFHDGISSKRFELEG